MKIKIIPVWVLATVLIHPAAYGAGLQTSNAQEVKAPKPVWGSVKMRIFEGIKEGAAQPVKAVTAASLNYTVTANIQSEADREAQEAKIKQIFNLKQVNLLTEADLAWEKGKTDKAFHFFRLEDRDYLVLVTPVDVPRLRFRIEVWEQKDGAKNNFLDTEFTIPQKNTAVFGFSDTKGMPYFISMTTLHWPSEVEASAFVGSVTILPAGLVRAIGEIKPPKLLTQVDPVYPPAARQAKVEGMVILETTTDVHGRVQNIKILRSIPLLDQAAIDAVRQWVYEPMVVNGMARGVIFTTTVRFQLDGKEGKPPLAYLTILPPVDLKFAKDNKNLPFLAYPEDALKAGVYGVVLLEAVVDGQGRVTDVKVVRPVYPSLDKVAVDALKLWTFEPKTVDGKPAQTKIVVSASFVLKPPAPGGVEGGAVGGVMGGVVGGVLTDEEAKKLAAEGEKLGPVRAIGDVQAPKRIKAVDPVYPEDARKAGIKGVVILEVETDVYGRIINTKVLRSVPLLDQAAIDAVRQWLYKPVIIEGMPRGCIFTVTVTFTLK